MSIENIDYLVKEESWSLGVCGFRFGGMFGFLVPDSNIFKDFEYHLQGAAGDISSVEFQSYVYNEGAWLPVSYGDTYDSVIEQLSQRIPSEEHFDIWLKNQREPLVRYLK